MLALPAFLPSVIISFLSNNKGEGEGSRGSLDLSPRSTTDNDCLAVKCSLNIWRCHR